MKQIMTFILTAGILILPLSSLIAKEKIDAVDSGGLTLSWKVEGNAKHPRTMLTIHGAKLPAAIPIQYLEAYCRANSTDADWNKHTVVGHKTELISISEDKKTVKLKCTVSDGVIVHHTIVADADSVTFSLVAHNPTKKRSEAHWAQPCIRVGEFCGFGASTTKDKFAYIPKGFIFVKGKLTRMPFQPWAKKARYVPGQVWCPANVPRSDVNPRPLSDIVPSNGLIGCFSKDEKMMFAVAWEPYQELFQGVIRCLHSDFRIGGLMPGETKKIRGKIYLVPNDPHRLLGRYLRDFREHHAGRICVDAEAVSFQALPGKLDQPFGVEINPKDKALYVCELGKHRIRKFDRKENKWTTVVGRTAAVQRGTSGYAGDGGPATNALLMEPAEVRFDAGGNMYIVDYGTHTVRQVDVKTGVISTIAGTGEEGFSGDGGLAIKAKLSKPHSIAFDSTGGMYIADIGNHRIRKVDLKTGIITTFAGNGERTMPMQNGIASDKTGVFGPRALAVEGRTLWVALREGHSIWKIDIDQKKWQRVAGTGKKGYSGDGGSALKATLSGPKGISIGRNGKVAIADTENHAIRLIDVRSGLISTISKNHKRPHGVLYTGDVLYVGDTNNYEVFRIGCGYR